MANYNQFAQDPNAKGILRSIYDLLGLDSETLMSSMVDTPPAPPEPLQAQQEGVMNQDALLEQQNKRIANAEAL